MALTSIRRRHRRSLCPFKVLDMASVKRVTLSVEERLMVLDDLKTFSVSTVAKKYKVHTSTIWRIKNNAPKVMEFIDKGKMQQKRRRIRPSLYDAMEQNLLAWFIERRTLGDFISNAVLVQKARELKDSMELPSDFKVSKGWLDGFKKRHNVCLEKVYGKSRSVDEDSAKKCCNNFVKLLEDGSINEDNIYNMDETQLLWKALPLKILKREEKSVTGYKSCKERITVALCTNASGTHKLMPLVINKYENPRSLKHCKSNLPVIFKSQKNAWMSQILFCDWFHNYFKPSVRAYQLSTGMIGKVILLLNNCRRHTVPPELFDEDDFIIMYFPPNTTSLIQPMNQGIIAKLKALYRHKTIQKAATYQGGINEFQKQFTLKDCIQVLHDSWMEVSADNIINSWKKLIPNQTDTYCRTMRQNLSNLTGDSYTQEDIAQFMSSCEDEETRSAEEEDEEKKEYEEMQEKQTDEEMQEKQEYEEIQEKQEYEEIHEKQEYEEIQEKQEYQEMQGKQEYQEMPENTEEQENKREELQYLFERLDQHVSQEAPFIQNIYQVFKNHLLGTDD